MFNENVKGVFFRIILKPPFQDIQLDNPEGYVIRHIFHVQLKIFIFHGVEVFFKEIN